MRIAIEPRRTAPPKQYLFEIVTPRTNTAAITSAENLFAAMSLAEPFALEIAATHDARWFIARAGSQSMRLHLTGQLGAAYPQADLRELHPERLPGLDPARVQAGERSSVRSLVLRDPPCLPLRTFDDAEMSGPQTSQADPVLGILHALGSVPPGWRALSQIVLCPAPEKWARGYVALMKPQYASAQAAGPSLASIFMMGGVLAAIAAGIQVYRWYSEGQWLGLVSLAVAAALAAAGGLWLVRRRLDNASPDPELVRAKISRPAHLAQIRLAVFAPADAPELEIQACLDRLVMAYRQFSLPAGNALVAQDKAGTAMDVLPQGPPGSNCLLNTRELASLWHLPRADADVPLVERTTARKRLPQPWQVSRGCQIGVSKHQGRTVPVALSDDLLKRHLLLVAKTRRGKSTLLLQIARHLMGGTPGAISSRPAVVLIDPHQDLARAALGLVPASRQKDVVYLDLANVRRPFGLNMLDVGLGWDADKAVANALSIFRHEFDRFWGPRMEDAFRFALLTLYHANEVICAADPNGRARQHTLLDVPDVLSDPAFRRTVLVSVSDPVVRGWWSGYFDVLERRLQLEIINPVQTKVHKFAGSVAARSIVGQPRSTIDPIAWLRSGAIVVVNTAKGTVGEDTAALLGGSLINLLALAIGEQANVEPERRRGITLLVDEFHTMPGADYESVLGELSKYGANLVLATQSLARLDALDREQHRALRATVFANLDGLFAFHSSAEDARYLVNELGVDVDEQDLLEMGEHQCYVRASAWGERLPVFSVELDPPPASDGRLADKLAATSAALYGREASKVMDDLRSALARVQAARRSAGQSSQEGLGALRGGSETAPPPPRHQPRSQHRTQKKKDQAPDHGTLFDHVDDTGTPPPAAKGEGGKEPNQ